MQRVPAVISAHKHPASSRAMAATTTFLESCGRPDGGTGRTGAAALPCPRDYLWVTTLLAAGDLGAHPGRCW